MRPNIEDDAFEALSNHHRRELLLALLEHNPQQEFVMPEDVPVNEVAHGRLRVEMHHQHLPKLEERGFITWDRHAHTVSKGPDFEKVRPVLEGVHEYRNEFSSERS